MDKNESVAGFLQVIERKLKNYKKDQRKMSHIISDSNQARAEHSERKKTVKIMKLQ